MGLEDNVPVIVRELPRGGLLAFLTVEAVTLLDEFGLRAVNIVEKVKKAISMKK